MRVFSCIRNWTRNTSDLSGLYQDIGGPDTIAAAKLATADYAKINPNLKVETDDTLFGKGTVRADGRKIHPAYLFQVKKPEESRYPGDFYTLRATIPGDEAFRPLKDGGCSLVKG